MRGGHLFTRDDAMSLDQTLRSITERLVGQSPGAQEEHSSRGAREAGCAVLVRFSSSPSTRPPRWSMKVMEGLFPLEVSRGMAS
eukprot:7074117-Prymnesium_polylepis.1